MKTSFRGLHLVVVVCCLGLMALLAEDSPAKPAALDQSAQKTALARWNSLIGGWRGTGQPRRGSNTGAWREDTNWAWQFSETESALVGTVTKGKLAANLKITALADKQFHLQWTSPEGLTREMNGAMDKDKIVFASESDEQQDVYRVTLTPLNEQRMLILFEKRKADQQSYSRVAEVGYTREGTRLAGTGGGQPECVVTGGLGTIKVEYKGKTYFVCCSGCQQAFNDDPEGILADYQARREKEKARK